MHLDATPFDLGNADPETLAYLELLERATMDTPNPIDVGVHALRASRSRGEGVLSPIERSEKAETRTISSRGVDIPLRIFTPAEANGVCLYFHGGGWVSGGPDQQDARLEAIADNSGVAVVSVGYRLAPEHPYPAPADDAEAAAQWIVGAAAQEYGTDRIVVAGASAGANLAVTAMLRMRDRHGFSGFSGAALLYGFYDLSLTPSARNWGNRPLVMTTDLCRWFADHYAAGADRRDPDVSPMYADVSGLAPALFVVGSVDPLLDDTLFLAQRWVSAGNEAELDLVAGGAHGFLSSPIGIAETSRGRLHDFIRRSVMSDNWITDRSASRTSRPSPPR